MYGSSWLTVGTWEKTAANGGTLFTCQFPRWIPEIPRALNARRSSVPIYPLGALFLCFPLCFSRCLSYLGFLFFFSRTRTYISFFFTHTSDQSNCIEWLHFVEATGCSARTIDYLCIRNFRFLSGSRKFWKTRLRRTRMVCLCCVTSLPQNLYSRAVWKRDVAQTPDVYSNARVTFRRNVSAAQFKSPSPFILINTELPSFYAFYNS